MRLREVRKAPKNSLAALSEVTGGKLSKSSISNYEQGLRRMGLDEAKVLGKALGTVSASYLLYLDEGGFFTKAGVTLLQCFRATDTRGRQAIVEMAESQRVPSGG